MKSGSRDFVFLIDVYVRQCFRVGTAPRVDELARALRLHPSVLSRTFRAETGQRLSAVLKARQLDEAKFLLASTEMTLAEIAQRAGFGTINTLFRLFRTRVGRTPEQYRRESTATTRH
jgi:AraC-like DNA-binding protein